VAALFLGNGTQAGGMTASDRRVHFGGKTSATLTGTYAIQIDALAQQASAVGGRVLDLAGLSQNETLTLSDGNATAVVLLAQLDTLPDVLSKINSSLVAQGIAATASDDGTGRIKISSTNYGSSQSLTISSDQGDLPGTTGFGTTPLTVTGTDIAGTINGHSATGSALTLTGAAGQPEEGLSLAISQTTTGSYGSVTLASDTAGVAGASVLMGMFSALDGLMDSLSGPITMATDGLKKNIDSLKDQIDEYEVRLAAREKLLTAEYDRADQALRLLTVTQASLSNQINALSKQ
jgi:flagellar hook-associated protein 2